MAIPFTLNAQERTLFRDGGDVESGFYCRPVLLKITTIDGEASGLGGIGGSLILANRVTLGFAWYWLSTDLETGVSGITDDVWAWITADLS